MQDKTNKTLGLVITDGVGVRNFVHGRFLSMACNTFDQVVLFSGVTFKYIGLLGFEESESGLHGYFLREPLVFFLAENCRDGSSFSIPNSCYAGNRKVE